MKRIIVLLIALTGCGTYDAMPYTADSVSAVSDTTATDLPTTVHPDSGVDSFRQAPDYTTGTMEPDAGVPDVLAADVLRPDTQVQVQRDVQVPDTLPPDITVDSGVPDTMSPDTMSPDTTVDMLSDTCRHVAVVKNCYEVPNYAHPSLTIRVCKIPAGCFTMGSPASDQCRWDDEDLHTVWITRSFEIQETEGAIVDPYDYRNTIRNFSTWRSAAKGCNALSRYANLPECYTCDAYDCTNTVQDIRDCKGFRLPTEAEWEYAYRAGTTTQFYHGNLMDDWKQTVTDRAACFKEDQWLDDYAVYYYTAPGQEYATRPKTKLPNAWGLYDMAGNMQEWVHDTYVEHLGTTTAVDPINEGGTKHFVRGGRAEQKPARLRGAYRRGNPTTFTTGLRCVRTL